MVDKITNLIKQNGFGSIAAFEKKLGFGNGIIGKWRKQSPSCDKLKLVADYLNVSVDYLINDEQDNIKSSISSDEKELLSIFSQLSDKSKAKIMGRAEALAEMEKESMGKNKHKYIEYYSLPASAGSGVDLDGCEKEMIKVRRSELTDAANFAVRISGSSMEPVFKDGQIALVRSQPIIEKGEIGIFIVNGNGYIKELGDGELISLNPKYDNVYLHENDDIYCRGEVIGTLEQEDIL